MATIDAQTGDNYAARTGSWLGRAWLKVQRREKQFVAWLAENGLPVGAAKTLLWMLKLALIAAAFYFFLVTALVVAGVWMLLSVTGHLELPPADKNKTEWRYGLHGYGQYDHKGERLDPYDPTALP